MVRFAQSIGAQRYQTFCDEARSEGYIGVEGDDPSIYWTFKDGASGSAGPLSVEGNFGDNQGRTMGVFALDVDTRMPIG